jgi:hypothetical protein
MSDTAQLTGQTLRTLWPSFKRRLEARFPGEDWIRSLYLFRVVRASEKQCHLLAAIPPNGKLISSAAARLPQMREMLKPNFNISLTTYPDEWQIAESQRRYGIDMAPKPWTRKRTA